MLIEDLVKIKYSEEGYLPNIPPHLISNREMCEAFILNDINFFTMTYPLKNSLLTNEYDSLINTMKYHICRYVSELDGWSSLELPNWVWSYMVGSVINDSSGEKDKSLLIDYLGLKDLENEMNEEVEWACYSISKKWCNRIPESERIVSIDDIFKSIDRKLHKLVVEEMEYWGVKVSEKRQIDTRSPGMFGEGHIIKTLRLAQ